MADHHDLNDLAYFAWVVHAVFASRRGMLPAVRQLVDFLAERYARLEQT